MFDEEDEDDYFENRRELIIRIITKKIKKIHTFAIRKELTNKYRTQWK